MTPERFRLLSELRDAAAALDPVERARFIDGRCANDDELRRELMDALSDADTASALTGEKAAALVADGGDPGMGRRLGTYRILRTVGEGGMGVVYEAEQEHPRRIVALKVIKAGVAGAELLRRFELESQVLARLQHPGIAQIYEAGAADTGFGPQPYFAMEFIHGVPLRQYAETHHLDVRRRLELMAKVCDAVEHAHQRGVIHRDLKPANILVDHAGQPKILDFGVARATDSDAHATRQTDMGQLIGTLAYMSPEQADADPLELDTRSDVYALGVILYELLANRRPYQLSDQLHEALRVIREEDPSRLSSISRDYRGDVEVIASKALEKDKTRRYASAAALADDLRRYLADQPITARPASTSYQLRKFARRHSALVGAVAAVFAVLVVGIVLTTWQAVRARRAEAAAVEAQQTAQAVNEFLQNDLLAQASASSQAGSSQAPDPDLKVRTALDRAAARISGRFSRQPGVEAGIRDTIGQTYLELGLYSEARHQWELALEAQRQVPGTAPERALKISSRLGYTALMQGKYAEAERLLAETLQTQRRVLGPEHPGTLYSSTNLASVYYSQGKYAESEALDLQILDIRRRRFGPDDLNTVASMNNLALTNYAQGKYAEAEERFSETVERRRRVLGAEHPETLDAMSNLGLVYAVRGKYAQAEALDSQILEIRRRVLGPEHPDTLTSLGNLAVVGLALGKFKQAEALNSQAVEIQRRVLGAEHPDTLVFMNNLGFAYLAQGRNTQAEALDRQLLEIRRRVLGPEHPDTLISMENLANDYAFGGKYPQAEVLYRTAVEISNRTMGPEDAHTLAFISDFASMQRRRGQYVEAESLALQAFSGRRRALGPEHPDTLASEADVALDHQLRGRFAESEPLAREALELGRKVQPDDWQPFRAASLLGASLAGQKRYDAAEPLLLEGYQGMLARKARMAAPDWPHLDRAREWIPRLYQEWGKKELAAEWRRRH